VVDFKDNPHHPVHLDFGIQILKPVDDAMLFEIEHQPLVEKLNWKLLGRGEIDLVAITRHLSSLSTRPSQLAIDTSRVSFVLDQRPDRVFVGLDEFDGYLAFVFDKTGKAVMENPLEGNAIYVFGNDWRQLSRLSKTEIMHSSWNHERIVHTGSWKARLLRCLR
jgi:hypothetical protein